MRSPSLEKWTWEPPLSKGKEVELISCPQNVVPGPATSASPVTFLEKQTLESHPSPNESEIGGGNCNLYFSHPPTCRVSLVLAHIEEPMDYVILPTTERFQWLARSSAHKTQSIPRVYYLLVPGGSVVKKLPAKQKTQVQSLGGEDPLEKEAATCSILAWEIPWTEEPGRPQSINIDIIIYYNI